MCEVDGWWLENEGRPTRGALASPTQAASPCQVAALPGPRRRWAASREGGKEAHTQVTGEAARPRSAPGTGRGRGGPTAAPAACPLYPCRPHFGQKHNTNTGKNAFGSWLFRSSVLQSRDLQT